MSSLAARLAPRRTPLPSQSTSSVDLFVHDRSLAAHQLIRLHCRSRFRGPPPQRPSKGRPAARCLSGVLPPTAVLSLPQPGPAADRAWAAVAARSGTCISRDSCCRPAAESVKIPRSAHAHTNHGASHCTAVASTSMAEAAKHSVHISSRVCRDKHSPLFATATKRLLIGKATLTPRGRIPA